MKLLKKFVSWYFTRQALPYWTILLADMLIIVFSFYLVFALANGTLYVLNSFSHLLGNLLIYLFFFVMGCKIFHTYVGVIRFSSFIDLVHVGLAMAFGLVMAIISRSIIRLAGGTIYFSHIEMLLATVIATALMWSMRIWVKILYDTTVRLHRNQKVFIYGARSGGMAIAKSINSDSQSPYTVVGFVADTPELIGHFLMGLKVYPNDDSLPETMARRGATRLLVSPFRNDELRRNDALVNALIKAGIKLMMLPNATEWDGKKAPGYTALREVSVEELLPRDKIEVDMDAISNLLKGKRIMVTGAAGSIGSEIVAQIATFQPAELILIDQAETPLHDIRLLMKRGWPEIPAHTIVSDIANFERMEEIFHDYRPEYVFHAAAYKHVPMMEDNPQESIRNNVYGTRNIADLAVKYGTKKFVMVSTDKAVNPTNVMGCSKRLCEIYVQALDKAIHEGKIQGETRFVTTRFGNVLGSNGSVIPIFEKQIKAGGPVTVTHPDIIRYFMLIPEACKLVLEAGTMGHGGEIFVFDMGEPVRIADLAKRMISMSGATNVEIKYTGLRDGEKLYEELLNDKEVTLPTFHEKIKIARVREYDYFEVNKLIMELVHRAVEADDMEIVGRMKAIVPEFKSQHSKYEALDKKQA